MPDPRICQLRTIGRLSQMAFETILTSQDGASFVITLNRPDRRNAFSVRMMQEIATACASADENPSVRGVIVTGGPRYFSAGADLNEAMAIKSTADGVAYMTHWETLNNAVERLAKPSRCPRSGPPTRSVPASKEAYRPEQADVNRRRRDQDRAA